MPKLLTRKLAVNVPALTLIAMKRKSVGFDDAKAEGSKSSIDRCFGATAIVTTWRLWTITEEKRR